MMSLSEERYFTPDPNEFYQVQQDARPNLQIPRLSQSMIDVVVRPLIESAHPSQRLLPAPKTPPLLPPNRHHQGYQH